MSRERLDEIAYNVGISIDGEKALMSSDDYDFLYNYAIEQAERVEELEKKLNIATEQGAKLAHKNVRYKQALEQITQLGWSDAFGGGYNYMGEYHAQAIKISEKALEESE